MKKIVLLPLVLLLSACQNVDNLSSTSSLDTTTSSTPLFTSKWGEELGKVLEKNFGVDLPYISCNSFSYEDSIDDYGDPLTIIYCYFDNEEMLDDSPNLYATECEKAGYEVELETMGTTIDGVTYVYDCYFADKVVSSDTGIELQFLLGADDQGVDCLGIFAFSYDYYDETLWPGDLISKYLDGATIPEFVGEDLTYSYWSLLDENNLEYLEVVVYNTYYEDETTYYNILLENGYTIDDSSYDEYGYIAISSDGKVGLNFFYDLNYYYGLVIYIFNLNLYV